MRIPSGCSKNDKSVIIDKVKGLLFGAIIGDSLGLATEGMTKAEISKIYGNGPIQFGMEDEEGIPFLRDTYRASFEDNDFGGDSEQQLLLLQSIIQNGTFNYKEYAKSLQEYSQHGLQGLQKKPVGINKTSQVVLAHPEFPNNPRKAAVDVWKNTDVLRRGASGALVRAALLGIPKFWDGTTVIENTTECCRITHPDPRCIISCVIVSTLVARILRGQDLENDERDISPSSIHIQQVSRTAGTTTTTTTTRTMMKDCTHQRHDMPTSFTLPPTPTDTHRMSTSKEMTSIPPCSHCHNHNNGSNNNMTPPPSSPTSSCYTSSSLPDYLETDNTLMKIVRSVIETNKRILTAPNTDPLFMTPETNVNQTQLYYQQLVETCSYFEDGPVDFTFLQLDAVSNENDLIDNNNHSYRHDSFKCLSAGLYSFTRHLPTGQETNYFKRILMDLVLQGGEADTNATVVGALLGIRIGYSNLPSEWVVGLKRWEWLEDRMEEFCNLL